MNVDNALVDSLKVLVGILLSSAATASGAADDRVCKGSWQYSKLNNGWGCMRPLTTKFSDHMCLTRGHHIALITDKDNGGKQNLVCIKDQSDRDCRVDNIVTDKPTTTSEQPRQPIIDEEDTKAKIDEMPDTKPIADETDEKSLLARPLGCCMPSLEG
ncbi:hypothetical protein KP79_PYT20693 [Mizuhopecten yessoensis]|uniref:Secreted protein n=1 Tax=Mizuhopecten yessoensis TaxID=6573 RepID=A0A210QLT0_MIZYE|nr:hypothetical protein KP79_PYT20693 [Mizuhopecten yessoensis]